MSMTPEQIKKITELMQAVLENDIAKEIIIQMKPSNSSK